MDKDLLIHQLLDGSLDPANEDALFLELSSDYELKNEFKQQLMLKNAMRTDTNAYTPKAESTTRIFSELGITEALFVPATKKTLGFFSTIWYSLKSPIASSLLTATIIGATFLGLNLAGLINFGTNENLNKTEIAKFKNDIPTSSSSLIEINKKEILSLKEKYMKDLAEKDSYYIAILKEKDNQINLINNDLTDAKEEISSSQKTADDLRNIIEGFGLINEENIAESTLITNDKPIYDVTNSSYVTNSSFPISLNESNFNYLNVSTSNLFNSSGEIYAPANLGLEIGGFLDNSLGDISNATMDRLNVNRNYTQNFRLAAYKKIDNWKIGVDIRRENFYQRFSYIFAGQYFINEQYPSFWAFSGFGRFTPEMLAFKAFGTEFSPLIQFSAGFASPAGPVVRVMLGSELQLFNYSHLTLGLEYSYLQYRQDDLSFQSDKISFQIGIGLGNAK